MGDNSDEKSTRLFGVIGELNRTNYSSKWRAGCNGFYCDLDINTIFDMTSTEEITLPDDYLSKIKHIHEMPSSIRNELVGYGGQVSSSISRNSDNSEYERYIDRRFGRERTPSGPTIQYTPWGNNSTYLGNSSYRELRQEQKRIYSNIGSEYKNDDGGGFDSLYHQYDEMGFLLNQNKEISSINKPKPVYSFSFDIAKDKCSHDVYRGLTRLLTEYEKRINDQPTVIYKDLKDKEFGCATQAFGELLDVLSYFIKEESEIDLVDDTPYILDLNDSFINLAGLLKFDMSAKNVIAAFAHELNSIEKNKGAASDGSLK